MNRTEELERQIRHLTQAVETLRSRLNEIERGARRPADSGTPSSRRDFLRLGGAAALGAVGAAALRSVPASAADGGNLILGQANLAETPTSLQGDGLSGPVPVLEVEDKGFSALPVGVSALSAPLQGLGPGTVATPVTSEGVDGWAGGALGFGVYGLTDAGYGVVGESTTGIGVYARRSGRLRQDGPGAGMPSHVPNNFEQVRDSSGVLWIHNASGVWRRVNTLRLDNATGTAPYKPFRRFDTRSGSRVGVGSLTVVKMTVTGSGDSAIPADAIAVVGNLTATQYTGPGWLAIMPAGITAGTGATQFNPSRDPSTVNFITGQGAIANSFVCGLNAAGSLQVYVAGSPTHFIIDITGYIQ
jgi:hypothetical protein